MTDRIHERTGCADARSACEITEELKKCTSLEQVLLDELQEMLEEPSDRVETRWVERTLHTLCETIDHEFELLEADGYLSEVLAERPSWDHLVEQLEQTHRELRDGLRRIRTSLSHPRSAGPVASHVRQQFRDWLEQFTHHKRREIDLLQEALQTDLGEGE